MPKAPTITNVNNVVAGMQRISVALPDAPEDALAALTFCLVELAVEANVPIKNIHDNIDRAMNSRREAARKAMS